MCGGEEGVRGCWGVGGVGWMCVLTERADGTINHGSGGRPCTGPAPAATFTTFLADMLSGPLSTNLDSPTPPSILASLRPVQSYPSKRCVPINLPRRSIGALGPRTRMANTGSWRVPFPRPGTSFAPFSLQHRGHDYCTTSLRY